jgi:ABC-type sugar transport system permease subunit
MPGPVIHYNTRYARTDWWMFSLYVLAAAVICAVLGYAMRRDELGALRGRAEYAAKTLAVQLAEAAETPGSDFSGTLPPLSLAMGDPTRVGVVQADPGANPGTLITRGRYMGHSEDERAGKQLDFQDPADKRALELVTLAKREGLGHPIAIWREGVVSAAAVAKGGSIAFVDSYRPPPATSRPLTFAGLAFMFLLIFGAGFQDVLGKLGRFLNLGVLTGVTWVFARLATALQPSLWRGAPSDVLVQQAEALKLVDIARLLSQDLAPPTSTIAQWGVRAAWVGCGFYFVALFGPFHRVGRAIRRHSLSFTFVSPALLTFLLCAGAPLLTGLVLAFWRATPSERSYLGFENFKAFVLESPAAPTSLWRTLATTTAWVTSSAVLQLALGLFLAMMIAQVRGRWRGIYRALFLVPWALPGYVGALLWSQMWRHPGEATHGVIGFANAAWLSSAAGGFAMNLLASVWMGAPFLMAIALALLDRLSNDQLDAARLEGVRGFMLVRHLHWPLLKPMLLPGFTFSLLWSLNAFTIVDLVSGGGPDGATDLLVTRAYRWAFERFEFGYAAAWSVIALLLAIAMALVLRWLAKAPPKIVGEAAVEAPLPVGTG